MTTVLGGEVVTPHPFADAFRVAALGLGGGLMILTLRVTVIYARVWWQERQRPLNLPPARVAAHVVLISLSYAVMTGASVYEIYVRVHEPTTFRTFLFPAAYVLGITAILLLTWNGRARFRRHRGDAN